MAVSHSFGTLPVVDVAPLLSPQSGRLAEAARQIEAACREHGFFYVTGHGVPPELPARLAAACAAFFELPLAAKMEIAMARGGRHFSNAWCNGSAGIGLSRIASWALLGGTDDQLLREAHLALAATLRNAATVKS